LPIHHAEKSYSVRSANGCDITNEELREIIEKWIEVKKYKFRDYEWKALVIYAPNMTGLLTLTMLI